MTIKSTIEIEVPGVLPGDCDYINVEFTIDAYVENDSFSHEFGTTEGNNYLVPESKPTWSRAKHTKWENEAITAYLTEKKNIDYVSDELIKLQEAEYASYEYDCHD